MPEISLGFAWASLQSDGDLVEQHAAQVQIIAKAICQYAGLWANYVLPARLPDNPALVGGQFSNLAELSYSALVRLLSAVQAAARVENSCESILTPPEDLGAAVLTVHESLFAFFCNAGAAIDLLEKAASDPSPLFVEPADQWGSAKWFFERRNGYIHQRITPVFLLEGLFHIDATILKAKNPSWGTIVTSPRELTELLKELLALLNEEMASGWAKLHDRLRQVSPPQPSTPVHHGRISSGSPW